MDPLVVQTCMEMLTQRGYIENEELGEEYGEDRTIYENPDGYKICVFNVIVSKFGVDRLTEYISANNEMGIEHCIVIYSNGVTPAANKVLSETTGVTIELFNHKELRYNITKHRLVPKHTKLEKKEADELKKKMSSNNQDKKMGVKFGTMFTNDAIARFYMYKPGDIIEIERNDGSIGYRIVKYRIMKNPTK